MKLLRQPLSYLLVLCAVFFTASLATNAQQVDPKTYDGMKWRLIGPFRGGRVLTVAGVPSQPNTYYFGAVGGGVWKTTDGGNSWDPLFDKEPISSIGALAVADSDPNVIYVGTGEACIRGNISFGDGVYKSTDAGKTWTNVGLKDTRHIGAVIIHPTNPDIVYVAALGHAYGPNTERGIFRTRDGGKTWEKVLYLDDRTGGIDSRLRSAQSSRPFCRDVGRLAHAVDSQQRRREGRPLIVRTMTATPGSASKATACPKARLGASPSRFLARIQTLFTRSSKPKKAGSIAATTAARTGLSSLTTTASRQRAWYFTHVWADPKNAEGVYIANTGLYGSTDGGKSFERINSPHGDNHALWIDPNNPNRMINGNDGGATISVDGGKNWTTQNNQPTAQFYHVAADNDFQFRVYGSQQDNSSIGIRTRSDHGAILDGDWDAVGGGESGYIVPDPARFEHCLCR